MRINNEKMCCTSHQNTYANVLFEMFIFICHWGNANLNISDHWIPIKMAQIQNTNNKRGATGAVDRCWWDEKNGTKILEGIVSSI